MQTNNILEIAGGSCRDSRYLANNNFKVIGSDFDSKTIEYLKERNIPKNLLEYSVENAFNLSFEQNKFDLVFHNGFFVLLNDDEIKKALLMQEYVSKKYIVFFVHNASNEKLVMDYKKLAEKDSLYDIRFFTKDEIKNIISQSNIDYDKIEILKFGGKIDALYNKTIKKYIPNIFYPMSRIFVPKLYQYQKWENTERLACIITLNK